MEEARRREEAQAQEQIIEDDLALIRDREERIRQLEVGEALCSMMYAEHIMDTSNNNNNLPQLCTRTENHMSVRDLQSMTRLAIQSCG